MPRAFWKGAISFGMVIIPVHMYTATIGKTLNLHRLHKKCFSRPRQVWYCPVDNEYLEAEDMTRGYEYTKGQFVTLEENDFKKVPLKTTRAIDIVGFVESKEIDPIYYREAYYVAPDELGVKPFQLLVDELVKTGRIGLAKVVLQRREHLCCLRPFDGIMALHTMFYEDEVISHRDLAPPARGISAQERQMADTLVAAMVKKFQPQDYHDEYYDALLQIIDAKVTGKQIKLPKPPKFEAMDLMSALRASVESAERESADRAKEREPVAAGQGRR